MHFPEEAFLSWVKEHASYARESNKLVRFPNRPSGLLLKACITNKPEDVRYLLNCREEGMLKVNVRIYNDAPIRLACEYGSKEVVEILLEDGITDHRKDNCHCLRVACRKGHEDIVKLLLPISDPTRLNNESIHNSIRYGHDSITNLLIEDGRIRLNSNENYIFMRACYYGREKVVRKLILREDVDPTDAKFMAARIIFGPHYNSDVARILIGDDRFHSVMVSKTTGGSTINFLNKLVKYGTEDDVKFLLSSCKPGVYCSGLYDIISTLAKNNKVGIVKDVINGVKTCHISLFEKYCKYDSLHNLLGIREDVGRILLSSRNYCERITAGMKKVMIRALPSLRPLAFLTLYTSHSEKVILMTCSAMFAPESSLVPLDIVNIISRNLYYLFINQEEDNVKINEIEEKLDYYRNNRHLFGEACKYINDLDRIEDKKLFNQNSLFYCYLILYYEKSKFHAENFVMKNWIEAKDVNPFWEKNKQFFSREFKTFFLDQGCTL